MNANFGFDPSLLIPVAGGFFVLLGIVVALVRMRMTKSKLEAIDRWGRAAYGLWTGGEDSATWPAARAQASLRDWYGATAGGKLWEVIGDLRKGTTGNPAWDKVRALDLLRIGMAATYLDAEACRNETAAIGAELQKQYRSWEELAQAFEAGMHAWQRSRNVTDPNELGRVQKNLPALRGQIWPTIQFTTSLVVD